MNTMNTMRISLMVFCGLIMVAVNAVAGPMIDMTLDATLQTGTPASLVTYSGSLSNSSGVELFLNSATGNISYSELSFDFTAFFTQVPLSLQDGESYTGPLFAVGISNVALPGDYSGSFAIQGGVDDSTFDTLAIEDFRVTVAPVPEPASVILLGSGLLGIVGTYRSRFKRK